MTQAALQDAAALAAFHSKGRGEGVVDVLWTERKHVKRARGAAPGAVLTAGARTVLVREDAEQIQRLYASRRAGECGRRGEGRGWHGGVSGVAAWRLCSWTTSSSLVRRW